ncbi:MAG: hypothetical protein JW839_14525 [Candidatus Lokiarchaeota archaeon]|nr:hypothetical protein [Candidatus Lokiarchaeota archaeon]
MFERIRRDVQKVLGQRRAGLSLGFVDMGMSPQGFVGGMFFSGGTMILMNTRALRVLLEDAVNRENPEIAEYYVYHVLMHEYIHSLGYLDERECREVTAYVTHELFPHNHPITIMADRGIGVYFPRFIYAPENIAFEPPRDGSIELVKGFDRGSTTYFT